MSSQKERAELFKTIWKIANDLRGAIDGWTFKAYVLGAIFYRYISEDICSYIKELQSQAGIEDFDYSQMSDAEAEEARGMIVDEKGFFILPSQLFQNVVKGAKKDENLNETLTKIFRSIEASAQGTRSESDMKGLFSDFAVDNSQIGATVNSRNQLLAKVLEAVDGMELGKELKDNSNDTFGDAYEFLMNMYASQAGKSGGEFFTPQEVSELLAMIASHETPNIKNVYDPACGSGSLVLKFRKTVGDENMDLHYYGQEINPTTYNLCRINMFLHHVNYENFDIRLGDTLCSPQHDLDARYDCIVSNPPYSLKWVGKEDPVLINDVRYADAGVLAPASAADLAFVMHMYYHLAEMGCCAIVEFPGVLYRSGAEQKIREYLLKENAIDTIIQLPANLFIGVGIATCIIVLKKQGRRKDNDVLFIDASQKFHKVGNKNFLRPEGMEPDYQQMIFEAYKERRDQDYFCKLVSVEDILGNSANLSVSAYVEQEDKREVINIKEVNTTLRSLIDEGNVLNAKIEEIVKELGEE